MNKLTNLIEQLCPNGVEFKPLGEIATISRGGSFQKKDFVDSGVPCIHYGQIYTRYGLFAHETLSFVSNDVAKKQRYAQPNDIVMAVTSENIEDVCKCVAWLGDTSVAVSGHSAIIHHTQNAKYLAYYFHSSMFFTQKRKLAQGTKVIEVSPDKLNRIIIPIPPLEVQAEIVRILDKFTELTSELTTELTNRKKQYEYYKDKLLYFSLEIPRKKIGEICQVKSGGTPSKSVEKYWNRGTIKWLGSSVCQNSKRINSVTNYITEEGLKHSSAKILHADTTLIAMVGATIGKVAYLTFDAATNQNIAALYPLDISILYPPYLYYVCTTLYNRFQELGKNGFTIASLSFIRDLEIPIPPLEKQKEIGSFLDRFDKLCNDISEGIPAEIEARQKQYEYYRDKLLTFKEVGTIEARIDVEDA